MASFLGSLGAALQQGQKIYAGQKQQQFENSQAEERLRLQREQDALSAALMKEQIQSTQDTRNRQNQTMRDKNAQYLVENLDDNATVSPEQYNQYIANTPSAMFAQPNDVGSYDIQTPLGSKANIEALKASTRLNNTLLQTSSREKIAQDQIASREKMAELKANIDRTKVEIDRARAAGQLDIANAKIQEMMDYHDQLANYQSAIIQNMNTQNMLSGQRNQIAAMGMPGITIQMPQPIVPGQVPSTQPNSRTALKDAFRDLPNLLKANSASQEELLADLDDPNSGLADMLMQKYPGLDVGQFSRTLQRQIGQKHRAQQLMQPSHQ